MVASVVGAISTAANFDAQPNQQSAPVHLTAGQQVFIEAFSKEATGNDHLEVAWTIPGFQRTIIQSGAIVPDDDRLHRVVPEVGSRMQLGGRPGRRPRAACDAAGMTGSSELVVPADPRFGQRVVMLRASR